LAKSVWLICAGRASEAEGVLREGIANCRFGREQVHAFNDLLWALTKQNKFEEMLEVGRLAGVLHSSDWTFQLNLAVAASHCGKSKLFLVHANRLRALRRHASRAEAERRATQLQHEVPWFAAELRMPPRRVCMALGVDPRSLMVNGNGSR
jgi:hypothetical protein